MMRVNSRLNETWVSSTLCNFWTCSESMRVDDSWTLIKSHLLSCNAWPNKTRLPSTLKNLWTYVQNEIVVGVVLLWRAKRTLHLIAKSPCPTWGTHGWSVPVISTTGSTPTTHYPLASPTPSLGWGGEDFNSKSGWCTSCECVGVVRYRLSAIHQNTLGVSVHISRPTPDLTFYL